jgi:hypothetical protein
MTAERKILIILGVIILAMAIFGFGKEERYDYSDKHGMGFGQPYNAPAYEYSVTYLGGRSHSPWDGGDGARSIQDHLNMMGAKGWALVHVSEGQFTHQQMFIFTRPVAQWR